MVGRMGAVAALAGALVACSTRVAPPPSKAVQEGLSREAQAACLCERSRKDHSACWSDFDHQTARYGRPQRRASACSPLSTNEVCFGDLQKGGFCIATGYRLEFTNLMLCSPAEARAVEAVAMRGMEQAAASDRPVPVASAEGEARRLAQSFIDGADPGNPPPSEGCAG